MSWELCVGLVSVCVCVCVTNVTLWSLMVKPKKNSGARAELLALICFILEPELSFLALIFYFGARAKFFGSGFFFWSWSRAVKACHLRLELT